MTKPRVCSIQFRRWQRWYNDYFGHHGARVAVKFALNLAPLEHFCSGSRTTPHNFHSSEKRPPSCKVALSTSSNHDVPISTLFCPSPVKTHTTRGGGCEIGKQVHCQGLANAQCWWWASVLKETWCSQVRDALRDPWAVTETQTTDVNFNWGPIERSCWQAVRQPLAWQKQTCQKYVETRFQTNWHFCRRHFGWVRADFQVSGSFTLRTTHWVGLPGWT